MGGFQTKSFTKERNVKVSAVAGQWAPCEVVFEWGFYTNRATNVTKAGDTLKISLNMEQVQALYMALGKIIGGTPMPSDEEEVAF
jgi:hypothetical protein